MIRERTNTPFYKLKPMTVQTLIDELSKLKDKSMKVRFESNGCHILDFQIDQEDLADPSDKPFVWLETENIHF